MRELTIFEMDEVSCGSSYSAGYETGKFVAKTMIAVAVVVTLATLIPASS
ncbi:hypothetical protein NRY95_04210 [Xanthomonas campestris pv. phormiicola]|nr:hypothetical protein [Xanthomonas translucens]MCC4597840.1 hypothetical protein [Xanthomonas campestris pv. phormiicola]UYC17180.1 hypothetical protein NRY95_04210 [Xanthomonas campestris pv. phormiicola]WLA07868.1 hypothetical protein MO328_16075 [Xanthomonas translucens]